ncbi:mannosyltransferase family protein [Singulisphaera sp. PoT]|uniref:mannosyltransferase family protein n=1 Tax=Singulisphaera sp. PoT TaxID=3411797 RepID=UPI003BF50A17
MVPQDDTWNEPIVAEPAPAESGLSFGSAIRLAVMAFLLGRGLLFAFDAVGVAMTLERPDSQLSPRDPWRAFPGHPFWDGWARWDSGWYRIIAERGYGDRTWGTNVLAFFPLFPYATRALATVVGNHWVAGLIVSNASLLVSLVFLARIAARYLDPDGVKRTLLYLLVYPSAFFLSAYYSEGLFLLVTVLAFHEYLSKRYLLSGFFGGLAALTRPTGIALFAAFALDYLWKLSKRSTPFSARILGLALIPAGLGIFMLMLFVHANDPFAFVKAHGSWGRSFASPSQALWAAIRGIDWTLPRDHVNAVTALDALTGALFLVLPLRLFKRYDPALPIYAMILILMPLSTGSLKSLLRLECVSFPAFLALAELGKSREADRIIVFVSALFLGLLNIRFSNWYWVG